MSRLVRIEVNVDTLVDELHAYVTDPPAVRRGERYDVLSEVDGPGTLGIDTETLEMMRVDGVHERAHVAEVVSWSLSACATAAPRAIRRVAAGRPTRREVQVLRLVAAGKTNQEIATALTVSRHTVKRHLDNLFAKLALSSRAEAAAYALREELL